MKNKVAQIILITILASILSYSIAQACSLIAPTIFVKCSNLKTSILAHESRAIGETFEDFQKRVIDQTLKNLHAVTPQCKEDLTPALDMFEQEIVKWIEFNNRRILLDRDLILEPYSIARESAIQKNKDDLLSCRYEESKHIGSWLIVFEKGRSYCYTYWYDRGGMCPIVILSLGHFLFYLITNPSLVSLPYLAGLFLMGGVIIYVWWRLLKNQPIIKLNKIVALSAIILVIEFFLIVMPFWVLGQIIGWILLFFLAILWYKRWKAKESASRSTAG
jgi:hypothetical protein